MRSRNVLTRSVFDIEILWIWQFDFVWDIATICEHNFLVGLGHKGVEFNISSKDSSCTKFFGIGSKLKMSGR
jgi:hypothetical protein